MTSTRRAAVLGGNRIPFARQFGAYAEASNQDMLTAALDGLVARYGLAGERLGEVVAGAVLKHSRDFNLTREAVLGSQPVADHAGLRRQPGLRHRARGRDPRRQQDRARADRVRHRRRRRHGLRRADRRAPRSCAASCCGSTAPRARPDKAMAALALPAHRPRHPGPGQHRAAHRPVDGRAHGASPPSSWGITREDQDELAAGQPPATSPPPTTAASSTTWSRPTSA